MSVLNELYIIHFDDKTAFVNQEAIGHRNCEVLLEIFCHLMEGFGYEGVKINFC